MTDENANLPAVHRPGTAVALHQPLDDARFDKVMREAEAAFHSTFLPTTLTKNEDGKFLVEDAVKANCFIVASVAHDMGVSFMAVAQSMSTVHGKLMFEGKLIAAVIEQRLGLRLRKKYFGEPGTDSYGLKVWTAVDETEGFEPIEGTVGEWKTKERSGAIKSIWVGANKQKNQLFYMAARVWARLNTPGLMLGIIGDDEVDEAPIEHAPVAPRISAGFASTGPTPDQKLLTAKNMVADAWAMLRDLEGKAEVGTPDSVSYAEPFQITGESETVEALEADHAHIQKHIDILVLDLAHAARKAAAAAHENRDDTKAGAEIDKSVDKPKRGAKPKGVSGAMKKAMGEAAIALATANSGLELRDLEKEDTFKLDSLTDDEAAQEVLGKMNMAIDRAKRRVAEYDAKPSDHSEREQIAIEEKAAAQQHQPPTVDQILSSLGDVLRPLHDWPKIKETFNGFAKQPEWKGFSQAQKNRTYALVWVHISRINGEALQKGDAMPVQPHQDVTAFRCAIEACPDAEAIQAMYDGLIESDSWKQQKEPTREAVAKAAADRMALLRAGA